MRIITELIFSMLSPLFGSIVTTTSVNNNLLRSFLNRSHKCYHGIYLLCLAKKDYVIFESIIFPLLVHNHTRYTFYIVNISIIFISHITTPTITVCHSLLLLSIISFLLVMYLFCFFSRCVFILLRVASAL